VPNYKRARLSLESIVRDGNRASAIIRRTLVLGEDDALPTALDINEVIREVVAFATHEISREHVALTTRLEERLPIVIADRVELQQVVLNHVRRVLHDQIQRHGTRPGHQPSDRRVPRWNAVG
jgi:signal transduction histidine kinase